MLPTTSYGNQKQPLNKCMFRNIDGLYLLFFRKKNLDTRKLTWFTQKLVLCVVEGGGSRSVFVGVCFRMCQFLKKKCRLSDFRATKSGGNWSEDDVWGNLLHRKWWKKS